MPSDAVLGVLLLSGSHDRAHYAFVVASGAAALGRKVVLFATNRGCFALCRDWPGIADANPANAGLAQGEPAGADPTDANPGNADLGNSGLADADRDARVQARGVAGLDTLRDACVEMDVRMIACEAGLRSEAVDAARLLPQVEVAGIATFLSAIGTGQIITI